MKNLKIQLNDKGKFTVVVTEDKGEKTTFNRDKLPIEVYEHYIELSKVCAEFITDKDDCGVMVGALLKYSEFGFIHDYTNMVVKFWMNISVNNLPMKVESHPIEIKEFTDEMMAEINNPLYKSNMVAMNHLYSLLKTYKATVHSNWLKLSEVEESKQTQLDF